MKVDGANRYLFGVDNEALIAFINLWIHTPQATKRGLAAQSVKICATESSGGSSERRDFVW